MRGHHVIRQRFLEEGLERITQLIVVVLDHQIRRQLLAGRAVNVDHHRLINAVVLQQAGFDFAQFDAEAANLHLVVDTPCVVDDTCVAITRQITGAVQPAAALLVERVGYETLGRQGCTVVITTCQTDATQIQLRRHALCSRQQAVVEDVGFQVVDRPPDRHAEDVIRAARPMGHVDGRFGGAIQVVQTGQRQTLEHLSGQFGRQCFTAAYHSAQRVTAFHLRMSHERLQHRRHEMQRRDLMLADGLHQPLGVAVLTRQRHGQTCAGHQRPEELPDRHVETERRLLQNRIAAIQRVGLLHPVQTVDQRTMAVACTLGFAGRTRGVNHISQIQWMAEADWICNAVTLQPVAVLIQAQALHLGRNRQTFQ